MSCNRSADREKRSGGLSAAESRLKAELQKQGREGGFPGTLKRPGKPNGWTGGKDPLFTNTADRGPV